MHDSVMAHDVDHAEKGDTPTDVADSAVQQLRLIQAGPTELIAINNADQLVYRRSQVDVGRPSERFEFRNFEGQLRRTDGPAVKHPEGSKAWYLNGVEVAPF